jgi:hypothetical protein
MMQVLKSIVSGRPMTDGKPAACVLTAMGMQSKESLNRRIMPTTSGENCLPTRMMLFRQSTGNIMDWQTYNQLCAMRRFNWLRDMRLIDRILADPIERSNLPSATIATLQENRRKLDTKLSIY